MGDLLEQYYRGITQQLRAEVDSISSLFEHQGERGKGNEAAIRDYLTRFNSRECSVGTGVVFDRTGKQSRQCDIVIYDGLSYPTVFSLASSHLFPVEVVRVVIEVKTRLSSQKAKIARQNVASVRKLTIPRQFAETPPFSREMPDGRRVYDNLRYSPAAGCVFAYNSDVREFQTFKNWFTPDSATGEPSVCPTLIGCLDQGIVRFRDTNPPDGAQPEGYTFPVRDEAENIVTPDDPKALWQSFNGVRYPVKQVNGESILVDQSQVLLLFSLYLHELIRIKKLKSRVHLPFHYLRKLEESALEV